MQGHRHQVKVSARGVLCWLGPPSLSHALPLHNKRPSLSLSVLCCAVVAAGSLNVP